VQKYSDILLAFRQSSEMRFIKLSETEVQSLQQGQRYGKHFLFRDCCQCLILSHHEHTIPQLTKLFKVHRITIYECFNLWEPGGIETLHKKSLESSFETFAC
jgi:hypothetical protein